MLTKFNQKPVSIFDFDTFFDNFLDRDFFGFSRMHRSNLPAVNVSENEGSYDIDFAVPGLNKADFKLKVDDRVLTVSSIKEEKRENTDDNYSRKEFSYSSFERSFTLPKNTNSDEIKASYENGILKINIPKKEKEQNLTRDIEIS